MRVRKQSLSLQLYNTRYNPKTQTAESFGETTISLLPAVLDHCTSSLGLILVQQVFICQLNQLANTNQLISQSVPSATHFAL